MWKVYKIDDGRIIKAGFETDEQAKDWLERRTELADDEYDVEEMDEEEIAEFSESEDEDEAVFSRHTKVAVDDDEDYAGSEIGDIDYGEGDADEDDGDLDDDDEEEAGDDDDDDDEDDDY